MMPLLALMIGISVLYFVAAEQLKHGFYRRVAASSQNA
jgi:hypothetical protein